MTRRAQVLVIAVLAVALGLPGVLMVGGVRPEVGADENRAVARRPELSGGALLRRSTYAALTAYLTDRLPGRDVAIDVDDRLDDVLAEPEPLVPGVPIGDDGWLYHPDTLVDRCPGRSPDRFTAALDRTAAHMDDQRIPFRFLVAPDKVSVHPEHQATPGVAGLLGFTDTDVPGCPARWNDALAQAESGRPALDALLAESRAWTERSDEPTFWRRDTHWTPWGQLVLVQAVLDAVGHGDLWNPDVIVPVEGVPRGGDLVGLRGEVGEWPLEVVTGYAAQRLGVAPAPALTVLEAPNPVVVLRATTELSRLVPGTVWVVGDSFTRIALPLLARYFEELVFVPWQRLVDESLEDVVDAVGSPPDALVAQMVQRNVAKDEYDTPLDALRAYRAT